MSTTIHSNISAQTLSIVDGNGRPRLVMSVEKGLPMLAILREDGNAAMTMGTDADGRPQISLANPNPSGPRAVFELDPKGAHLRFERPGGASAYMFLNDQGGSGVVLIDQAGARRFHATLAADGSVSTDGVADLGKGPLSSKASEYPPTVG